MFEPTEWKYSKMTAETDAERPQIEFGERYLSIENAVMDEDAGKYQLSVKDMQNGASFNLYYWMQSANKETGAIESNNLTIKTLNTLGEALAGRNIGVPNPVDIIGGIVMADVKPKTGADGKTYARVYVFKPVCQEMAALSAIDQYYTEG